MHQNRFPCHSRVRDPSAEARDRADAAEHQRRVRLIEKAQHRFDFFAAAAARAGLIRPRKETAQ